MSVARCSSATLSSPRSHRSPMWRIAGATTCSSISPSERPASIASRTAKSPSRASPAIRAAVNASTSPVSNSDLDGDVSIGSSTPSAVTPLSGDGEALAAPGLEAADDVARLQPEAAERCRGKARLVTLVADQDHADVAPRQIRIAVFALRVESPLEHVARDSYGAWYLTVSLALRLRSD